MLTSYAVKNLKLSWYNGVIREEKRVYTSKKRTSTPHDEAFKKLLHTFFAEFMELFFPELNAMLDHRHTRFLMQELLVDIVGEEARQLDLLIETCYKEIDAYILIHLEPQSYLDPQFAERMFIYYSRLFERHRAEHKLIIPIAIFTYDDGRTTPASLERGIPGHQILNFQYLNVELRNQNWRRFIDSDNPVAAALLAKMGYNQEERRDVRFAFLRMILRLRRKLDDARIAMIMSVADLYFEPDQEEDDAILAELSKQYPKEGAEMTELMPAWKRWGYEEGIEQGIEQGKQTVVLKLLDMGLSLEDVATASGWSVEQVLKLKKS